MILNLDLELIFKFSLQGGHIKVGTQALFYPNILYSFYLLKWFSNYLLRFNEFWFTLMFGEQNCD
jgi:hypothetical protein